MAAATAWIYGAALRGEYSVRNNAPAAHQRTLPWSHDDGRARWGLVVIIGPISPQPEFEAGRNAGVPASNGLESYGGYVSVGRMHIQGSKRLKDIVDADDGAIIQLAQPWRIGDSVNIGRPRSEDCTLLL